MDVAATSLGFGADRSGISRLPVSALISADLGTPGDYKFERVR